jgi:hypothetical protein
MDSAAVDSARANRRETVLKKAGIIVAASAAGLLAVAPLAFASQDDKGGDGHRGGDSVEFTQIDVDSHDCGNQAANQTANATGNSGGLLNLLGLGVAANVAANALNCNDILSNVNVLSNESGDDNEG